MFNIDSLLRKNIRDLKPYSSARDEFKGEASVFLDANENSLGSPLMKWYNRYPDPLQINVKEKISFIKKVPTAQMFLGNGSDALGGLPMGVIVRRFFYFFVGCV